MNPSELPLRVESEIDPDKEEVILGITEDNKESYTPDKAELEKINFKNSKSTKFYRGKPNASNHNTGYKGRTAIHEVLEINNEMRQLIFDGENQNQIYNKAVKNGMTSLRDAGINKIKSGVSTIEEVLRATVEDN